MAEAAVNIAASAKALTGMFSYLFNNLANSKKFSVLRVYIILFCSAPLASFLSGAIQIRIAIVIVRSR